VTAGDDAGERFVKGAGGVDSMTERWTVEEVRTLARCCYFPVLREELAGGRPVKADALREAEAHLPHRTHHTLKDRCYRISSVLDRHGYPWVEGWKPPEMVGQTPNSAGAEAVIR